jgi:hypothetical protein
MDDGILYIDRSNILFFISHFFFIFRWGGQQQQQQQQIHRDITCIYI